jgi:hypothetical protein
VVRVRVSDLGGHPQDLTELPRCHRAPHRLAAYVHDGSSFACAEYDRL